MKHLIFKLCLLLHIVTPSANNTGVDDTYSIVVADTVRTYLYKEEIEYYIKTGTLIYDEDLHFNKKHNESR